MHMSASITCWRSNLVDLIVSCCAAPYSDLNLFYFQTAICEEGRRPQLPACLPDSVARVLHSTWQADRNARLCFEDLTGALDALLVRLAFVLEDAPPLPLRP
jgi:hypothetical protein